MNDQLREFARQNIKNGLSKLEAGHHLMFKRMYSHTDLDKNINDVVDSIPDEKLDWAMCQVKRTVDSLKEKP